MAGPKVEQEEEIGQVGCKEDCQPLPTVDSGGSWKPHLQLNKILVISQMGKLILFSQNALGVKLAN